jgi:hypothetical protein
MAATLFLKFFIACLRQASQAHILIHQSARHLSDSETCVASGTTQVKVLSFKPAFTALAVSTMWGNMVPRPERRVSHRSRIRTPIRSPMLATPDSFLAPGHGHCDNSEFQNCI